MRSGARRGGRGGMSAHSVTARQQHTDESHLSVTALGPSRVRPVGHPGDVVSATARSVSRNSQLATAARVRLRVRPHLHATPHARVRRRRDRARARVGLSRARRAARWPAPHLRRGRALGFFARLFYASPAVTAVTSCACRACTHTAPPSCSGDARSRRGPFAAGDRRGARRSVDARSCGLRRGHDDPLRVREQ